MTSLYIVQEIYTTEVVATSYDDAIAQVKAKKCPGRAFANFNWRIERDDEANEWFQQWLGAVDKGYKGTLDSYRNMFDDEGELV